jgi:hypothetical protein
LEATRTQLLNGGHATVVDWMQLSCKSKECGSKMDWMGG